MQSTLVALCAGYFVYHIGANRLLDIIITNLVNRLHVPASNQLTFQSNFVSICSKWFHSQSFLFRQHWHWTNHLISMTDTYCYISGPVCVDRTQEIEGRICNPFGLAIDFRQQAKTIGFTHRPVARHGPTRTPPGLPAKLPGLPSWPLKNKF